MRKQLIFLALVIIFSACGESKTNNESDERNSDANVENYSEENISPQLRNVQDTNSRLEVDTISSSQSAIREKRDSLELK